MSFFSKISELFYDLFVTEPEEEEYIDSVGEDGKEAGPRMAGALPARAVRPLDAVIFVPRAYSDARRAVDAMEKGLVVLVVLGSNVDDETASRFVDFMSGAVYLGKGEVELLNGQVLLCAPSAVHIEMDSLPRLAGIPLWRVRAYEKDYDDWLRRYGRCHTFRMPFQRPLDERRSIR